MGLRDHVTVAGEVPEARTLLAGLDVFALPSKLEGSSNALAEAMVAGVATVTTPVADAEEILRGAGIVSQGWTARAFADAILEALERGPALRCLAKARGEVLTEARSPQRLGARWAVVVEEAIDTAKMRTSGGLRGRG
jgi:glycosyltransferase involved in cell wall biosynthesis